MTDPFQRVTDILRDAEDVNLASFYESLTDRAQFLDLKTRLESLALGVRCSLRRARIFKVLADMMASPAFVAATGDAVPIDRGPAPIPPESERALMAIWGEAYEELAFANVRLALEKLVPAAAPADGVRLTPGRGVRVEVPARIDLGGGWSDTPPVSLEKGGAVCNMAITLDGDRPIKAWARALPRPIIRLESLDLGASQEIADLEEMQTFDDLEDPLALLKAAAVFEGFAPRDAVGSARAHCGRLGAGFELVTECRVPKGSGLGTSSILAAAAVAALAALRGEALGIHKLFNHVLCVEQMMTTGGGWQDQVGGAAPGIKTTVTRAESPLEPVVTPVTLSPALMQDFNARLVLCYTGHNRLAKNILRDIMGAYLSRREPVFGTLRRIRDTADALHEAFGDEDLNRVGVLMSQSWELNKRLNPTTSNAHIDWLFEAVHPHIVGGKLAGAGGGGFMALLAKDHAAAATLRHMLDGMSTGSDMRLYDVAVDTQGLIVADE